MSDTHTPAFSSRSLDAAHAQLERWGVASHAPLEERTVAFVSALRSWSKDRKYGVEDAIRSGTRVRLLDQMPDADLNTARMNCAETGANLLLLAHAMGRGKEARLLRYNWGNMLSDHVGLVLLDDEREPAFIDPLAGHYGRVRLSKHGVFLRPDGAVRSKKAFKGSWSLLDEEDLVRHIRYLNSPLGFFPYYENGQVIRADVKGYPRFEYQIQTKGDDLIVRAVCDDVMPDRYTLERTLQQYAGHAIERTTEYLHADVGFARIEKPVFSLEDSGQFSTLREQRYDKESAPIWMAACHLRKREIMQQYDADEAREAVTFWNRFSRIWNEAQYLGCKEILRDTSRKEQEEKPPKYGRVNNTLRLCRRLRALSTPEQWQAMGVRLVGDMFEVRDLKREDIENAHALWNDGLEEECVQYIATRRAMFKKDTHAFFTSPVYETLVGQYREALMVKRAAQGLLGM